MKNYKQFRAQLLKDKQIKRVYKNFGPEFNLIVAIIKRRTEKGLTQKELAQKIGTRQSAISRLESGNYNPSLGFLQKVAIALGARVKVTIS